MTLHGGGGPLLYFIDIYVVMSFIKKLRRYDIEIKNEERIKDGSLSHNKVKINVFFSKLPNIDLFCHSLLLYYNFHTIILSIFDCQSVTRPYSSSKCVYRVS
ncbi:unnamed protein product [Chrysodeixis includens]|uniref:Uncharacterized protein n=1 Tax=Chrysodeixis includens TaxID=689277 RepID=A0A9P0GYP0_CHRIL|nr:unnamed protein product [Chrysodeixis includens]